MPCIQTLVLGFSQRFLRARVAWNLSPHFDVRRVLKICAVLTGVFSYADKCRHHFVCQSPQ